MRSPPCPRGRGAETRREKAFALFPKRAERRRRRAGTMSGGRAADGGIARAPMSPPELLPLDEPSLGLAPVVVGEIFDALARIRDEGLAILLVERNVDESLTLAARGYGPEAGRIVAEGSSGALREDPAVARAFLGGRSGEGPPPGRDAGRAPMKPASWERDDDDRIQPGRGRG